MSFFYLPVAVPRGLDSKVCFLLVLRAPRTNVEPHMLDPVLRNRSIIMIWTAQSILLLISVLIMQLVGRTPRSPPIPSPAGIVARRVVYSETNEE
jgi:hypothetical protein